MVRLLLLVLLLGGLYLVLATRVSVEAPEPLGPLNPGQPNVLVILLDDWGVDRMDSYTPSSSRTPFLDEIASLGQRYRRAYTDPLCSPSRAAALTGMLGVHTGVTKGFPWVKTEPDTLVMDLETLDTLPELLRPSGYATAAIGKWHLTGTNWKPDPYMHPIEFGFDVHKGPITNFLLGRLGTSYDDYEYNEASAEGATQSRKTVYATTQQVDDTLEWIGEQGSKPWFVWLALNAPHKPWTLPPQDLVSVDLAHVVTPQEQYDAVLEAADKEIGRLFASLNEAVKQNTVIIIMGDNGTPLSAFDGHASQKKGTVSQGGIHVPLMVWHASVEPGVVDELVHIVDLHATILELAGASPAARTDSISFAPVIEGAATGSRDTVYVSNRSPIGFGPWDKVASAALDKTYKLREQDGSRTLYRIQADGQESLVRVPYDSSASAAVIRLAAELDALEP